jgi:hypothetical protein
VTERTPNAFTWNGAAERLERLALANRRATIERLRSLSEEESIAIFEDLSEGIPEIENESKSPPPVVLFRIWRR